MTNAYKLESKKERKDREREINTRKCRKYRQTPKGKAATKRANQNRNKTISVDNNQ